MPADTNMPDAPRDSAALRVELERTLAEKDALLDSLRKVAVERDRIKEEADNRSSFWRRRFQATGAAVLFLIALAALTSWIISWRLDRVTDDVSDVKQSVTVLEKTTTKYARDYVKSRPGTGPSGADREQEAYRLKSEAVLLKQEIARLRKTVDVLKKVDDMRSGTSSDAVSRLKKQFDEELKAVRQEKEDEIEDLEKSVVALENEVAVLRKSKGAAIPVLIDALSHPDAGVQLGAATTLRSLTEMRFGTDQVRWRRWWSANRVKYLID